MNELSEILNRVSITAVWQALGGEEPRCGRAPAFWRNTRDRNVSLNNEKGTWFDFVTAEGGDIIALVQRARECTPKEALEWLAAFAGIPLESEHLTTEQRRERTRRWRAAKAEAMELVMWKSDLLEALRHSRDSFLHTYHNAERYLRTHSFGDAAVGDWKSEIAFDTALLAWQKVEYFDRRIDRLKHASYAELIPLFRAQKRTAGA